MKQFLLSTAMALSIAVATTSVALAVTEDKEKNTSVGLKADNGVEVQIGGTLEVQYGNVEQKKDLKDPNGINGGIPDRDNLNKMLLASKFTDKVDRGFANNTKLKFKAKKKDIGCNLEYGGLVELNADVSQSATFNRNVANKTMIYLQGEIGRAELGSYDGAGDTLKISAINIAKATGGIDGDYSNWVPFKAVSKKYNYAMNPLFLTDAYLPYSTDHAKKSNKATYYTPNLNGLTFGVSYVPDVDIKGTSAETIQYRTGGYKDVIDTGIKYQTKLNNDFELAGSAIAEFGKAKNITFSDQSKFNPALTKDSILKRKNLRAWEVGGQLGYKGFILAGSYGDWGKSGKVVKAVNGANNELPLADMKKNDTKYWTLGTSYSYDKFGASLTYMNGKRGLGSIASLYDYLAATVLDSNATYQKSESISVGVEYQALPGLLPYAEFTNFRYKTKLPDIKANKGNVVLTGVKISF